MQSERRERHEERLTARVENGILCVSLNKTEKTEPESRSITVG